MALRKETGGYADPAPATFYNERRDCAVRALSAAAALDYSAAHALCKAAGRKDREGMCSLHMDYAVVAASPKAERALGARGRSLSRFVVGHPSGCYVVLVTGHYVAIIDSVVYDWRIGSGRRRVKRAWRLA